MGEDDSLFSDVGRYPTKSAALEFPMHIQFTTMNSVAQPIVTIYPL